MSKKTRQNTRLFRKIGLNSDRLSTEQIRMICTNIEMTIKEKTTCLMITSPRAFKQKPLISSKLAITFASLGKKVLLVDGNLRHPSLHGWFHTDNSFGITNIMLESKDIDQCVRQTFQPNLFILTTGTSSENNQDLFYHHRLERMLLTWKDSFDLILIEAPAYLEASEAQVIANACNGILLIVKQYDTKKEDALKVKQAIERTNNKLIGVIYQTK